MMLKGLGKVLGVCGELAGYLMDIVMFSELNTVTIY